jgi:hypothetical protein
MTVIRYSAGKLLGIAFLMAAFAAFWLWVLVAPKTFMDVHGRYGFLIRLIAENAWVSGILFAGFAGVAVLLLSNALGDRTALAIGPDGVEVRTTFGRHKAGWDQVAGIGIAKVGRLSGGGETLNVRLRQALGEKVLRLSPGLLAQSRWEINRLLDAIGRPGVGTTAGADPEAEAAPAMDYDAVIARHLAARESNGVPAAPAAPIQRAFDRPAAMPQAPRGGFGRKGL